jgi:hypothetical protein
MKTRLGFVSNSSSSSFVIYDRSKLTATQLTEIFKLQEEGFSVEEIKNTIRGSTIMDNIFIEEEDRYIEGIEEFLLSIGITSDNLHAGRD